jgi:hypothetical protein
MAAAAAHFEKFLLVTLKPAVSVLNRTLHNVEV